MTRYTPTTGDLAFRDAHEASKINSFENAELLRDISDTYLAVLIEANTKPGAEGTLAMLQAEMTRRGGLAAKQANRLAAFSLALSALSVVVALIALFAR